MPSILYVEDEPGIQDSMQRFFERESFQVLAARGRSEALSLASRHTPDIAVLDVMLNEGPEPEHDGYAVCKALRDAGYGGPVIFLTARTSEEDKLTGFELGADDYVTKPFSFKELSARVAAVLRRAGGARSVYRFGAVEVHLELFQIRHGDETEKLSKREQELLRYLIEHRGKVLDRAELLEGIWHYSPNVTTRTVDTHILNVRKKLRDDASNPQFIETLHGVGYRFIAEPR